VRIDVRIIAATQRNLKEEVRAGSFREDLFYHLNVVPLHTRRCASTPRTSRTCSTYYVDFFATHEKLPYRRFSVGAQNFLRNYSWPGNVRELKNLVQRVLILGAGDEISTEGGRDRAGLRPAGARPLEGLVSFDQPLRRRASSSRRPISNISSRSTPATSARWRRRRAWSGPTCIGSSARWALKIIILGAGQVGTSVAEHLASEANDITVVDTDGDLLRELHTARSCAPWWATAPIPMCCARPAAEDADMIIAVTNSDETNMIACQVAYTLFRTPTKIARVRATAYLDQRQAVRPRGGAHRRADQPRAGGHRPHPPPDRAPGRPAGAGLRRRAGAAGGGQGLLRRPAGGP
jgi:hypothetical protein